jgi:DNA-binding HxlR family transcriptional regulator
MEREIEALGRFMGRKWRLPVLALLWARKGEKFVTLFRTLGASQAAVRGTLDGLIEAGLVAPNPGYGHPMRPEYVLTDAGRELGERCEALVHALGRHAAPSKWELPIVRVLADGDFRFNELSAAVPGVTDRALVIALKRLTKAGLVRRWVEDSYPPAVWYGLTADGRYVALPLAALVRSLAPTQ